VRNLAVCGLVCLFLGLAWKPLLWLHSPALSFLATAAVWLWCSKVGKRRYREQLMDALPWKGDEQVLDVGCGSGLLLVGAAKRLTTGVAFGVDLWRSADLSGNRPETALRNASLEDVAGRVTVVEGDARRLPFGDATFDVVVSLNVLHNIPRREEREQALAEIVRVLRPGGRCLIADFRNTGEYARVLRRQGIPDAQRRRVGWILFLPGFAAIGKKSSD
jgi:ubiquinone/menaquinone biosynthesis C-methylase UbiE